VEAAALAGALQLCDEDPEGTATSILLENLFPSGYEGQEIPEEYTVEVVTGYYDESGLEDFTESSVFGYSSFIEADAMPADTYVNSILVKLRVDQEVIVPGILGEDDVTVQVQSLAYLKRYGLLSLGEENDDGIFTASRWENGYPRFENMGRIHANTDIDFTGGPPPQSAPFFDDKTTVTAVGDVSNCPGGISNAAPVYYSRSVDEEMDRLRQEAEESGVVIRLSDFPPYDPKKAVSENRVPAPNNNYYYRHSESRFFFGLHDGDHEGITYYIEDDGASPGNSISLRGTHEELNARPRNFTVASDVPIDFWPGIGGVYLGGKNEDAVYVICSEGIGVNQPSLSGTNFEGVVFRTEKQFRMAGRSYTSDVQKHYVRVIAEEKITIEGYGMPQSITFDGSFGPPCPLAIVKLGHLSSPH
jgi:hypothetical protein